MTIINRIFMSVILLSVAGSVVGSIFLATQNLIYKHTSANFVITINKIAMLCFVIPFFAVWGIYDGSIKDFAQYDPLILVGQGTIKDAVRTAMDIILLGAGWLMGGIVGIGSVIAMATTGIFIDAVLKVMNYNCKTAVTE